MNECVNLRNLYSIRNTYTKQDIDQLRNLKRIFSKDDKYRNESSCFLEDLFKNNRLEYINIVNGYSDGNILGNMTLSQNIANLRYMDIYQTKAKYDITLDVSNEFPANMSVYYVETNGRQHPHDPDDILWGTITGPEETVKALEAALI